jgi:peroxiredoxin
MQNQLIDGQEAPDFELPDIHGKKIHLSDFRGQKVVVLAFLRGFM